MLVVIRMLKLATAYIPVFQHRLYRCLFLFPFFLLHISLMSIHLFKLVLLLYLQLFLLLSLFLLVVFLTNLLLLLTLLFRLLFDMLLLRKGLEDVYWLGRQ